MFATSVRFGGNIMSERRIRNNKIRRQRELKKHFMITIVTFCMISILAITFGSSFSKAKDAYADRPVYKYFTSIMVKSGDSLYSIAYSNMSAEFKSVENYINEIKHINSLENDTIHVGQYLIIPYYSTEFR